MKRNTALGVIQILLTPFFITWFGFVAHKLWAWFVVPVFNLPHLAVSEAAGIALLARLYHSGATPVPRNESEEDRFYRLTNSISMNIWWPAIALLVGLIIRLFLPQ